jgi:hypothetical protein
MHLRFGSARDPKGTFLPHLVSVAFSQALTQGRLKYFAMALIS